MLVATRHVGWYQGRGKVAESGKALFYIGTLRNAPQYGISDRQLMFPKKLTIHQLIHLRHLEKGFLITSSLISPCIESVKINECKKARTFSA